MFQIYHKLSLNLYLKMFQIPTIYMKQGEVYQQVLYNFAQGMLRCVTRHDKEGTRAKIIKKVSQFSNGPKERKLLYIINQNINLLAKDFHSHRIVRDSQIFHVWCACQRPTTGDTHSTSRGTDTDLCLALGVCFITKSRPFNMESNALSQLDSTVVKRVSC